MSTNGKIHEIKEHPPKGGKIATHEETLRLLTEQARNGSVQATVALARELRAAEKRGSEVDDAIDRILE